LRITKFGRNHHRERCTDRLERPIHGKGGEFYQPLLEF
jgi:hypothetical protein